MIFFRRVGAVMLSFKWKFSGAVGLFTPNFLWRTPQQKDFRYTRAIANWRSNPSREVINLSHIGQKDLQSYDPHS